MQPHDKMRKKNRLCDYEKLTNLKNKQKETH